MSRQLREGDLVKKKPGLRARGERVRVGIIQKLDGGITFRGDDAEAYVQWDPHIPEDPTCRSWHRVGTLKRIPPLVGLAMQATE